jgi:ABC-type transport system involved in multi-copper enzyme maturation permease subunit
MLVGYCFSFLEEEAMFWTITKRELLDCLLSLRFTLAVILCFGMTILGFYVSLKDYERRLEEYQFCVRKQGQPVSMNAIYREPEKLGILSQGLGKKLGMMIETRAHGASYVTFVDATGSYAGRQSHYLKSLASVDFAFVVRVIFALLALFLSYHLISGENEAGTLRLSLSNPIPRSVILFGKFCGGIIPLIISMTISFLIGLITLLFVSNIQFDGEEWIRMGTIYFATVLYLTCFFSLGVLASSVAKTSSMSLLIGIMMWICLVFIIPNLAITLTAEVQPVPTEYEMEEKVNELMHALDNHLDKFFEAGDNEALGREIAYVSGQIENIHHDYTNQLYNQVTLSERLSAISPASAFSHATSQFARTDAGTYRNMLSRVREYTDEFDRLQPLLFGGKQGGYVEKMRKVEASFDMKQTLDESLSIAMPNILILFLLNALFLVSAYSVFLRYEIK